jgi:hypothetical protein
MHNDVSRDLAGVSRHSGQVNRSNERLCFGRAGLELAKEGLRTSRSRKKRSDQCSLTDRKTYTSTPLVNSHVGSWTTPLIVTLSMSKTESTVAAKMYKMDCASCSPGHALLGARSAKM